MIGSKVILATWHIEFRLIVQNQPESHSSRSVTISKLTTHKRYCNVGLLKSILALMGFSLHPVIPVLSTDTDPAEKIRSLKKKLKGR